jgi:hypothetical protein
MDPDPHQSESRIRIDIEMKIDADPKHCHKVNSRRALLSSNKVHQKKGNNDAEQVTKWNG